MAASLFLPPKTQERSKQAAPVFAAAAARGDKAVTPGAADSLQNQTQYLKNGHFFRPAIGGKIKLTKGGNPHGKKHIPGAPAGVF